MKAHIDDNREFPIFNPVKAMRHLLALIKDNEDTEHVFHIMDALKGRSGIRKLRRFSRTPSGQDCLKRRLSLPPILDNYEELRKLPSNSVAAAYMSFMKREGLSAAGLVKEDEKSSRNSHKYNDDLQFLDERMRDTHDLLHVLSGYGRDPLGELSVLAFTYPQNGGLGNLFISYFGAFDLSRKWPRNARIISSIREAHKNGKRSIPLISENIVELLKEPIEDARKRLNIMKPRAYDEALHIMNELGYNGQYAVTW